MWEPLRFGLRHPIAAVGICQSPSGRTAPSGAFRTNCEDTRSILGIEPYSRLCTNTGDIDFCLVAECVFEPHACFHLSSIQATLSLRSSPIRTRSVLERSPMIFRMGGGSLRTRVGIATT